MNFIDNHKTNNHENECFIPYTKTISKQRGFNPTTILKDEIDYCCDKFNEEYENCYGTIDVSASGAGIRTEPEFDGDGCCYSWEKINYCPFCGKPIKTECVKTFKEVLKECKEEIIKTPVYELEEV